LVVWSKLARWRERGRLWCAALAVIVGVVGLWAVALVGRAAALPSNCAPSGATVTCTFGFTGAAQTFDVPAGVSSISVDARGAEGGAGGFGSFHTAGGGGARVQGTLALIPGSTLQVNVGGQGPGNGAEAGGFNGGGYGGSGGSGNSFIAAGGGGGTSDIRDGADGLSDRLLVAAGGGGGGGYGLADGTSGATAGGPGGASSADGTGGESTTDGTGGGPGLAGGGGAGGSGGAAGSGGGPPPPPGHSGPVSGLAGGAGGAGGGGNGGGSGFPGGDGGGGGGGYYGGGAGGSGGGSALDFLGGGGGGGGGGSNYTGSATGVTITEGFQSGHGQVTISYTQPAPAASTGSASDVTHTSATLHGTVNPRGLETTYFFQYRTSTAYRKHTSSHSAGSGTTTDAVSALISGLTPGTTYHYRLVAHNAAASSEGADHAFTTPARPLKLTVAPHRAQAGRHACFAFRATSSGHPVKAVVIHLAGHTAHTSHTGEATICLTLHRRTYHPSATKHTYHTAHATITATAAPKPKPSFTG
jgi:hypothetical protein